MKLLPLTLPTAQVQGTLRSDTQHLNEVIKIETVSIPGTIAPDVCLARDKLMERKHGSS